MTPFGEKVRVLRRERGATLKKMADAIGVSSAYLSALERGHRGQPSWYLVQRVISFFNVIWDEAEELERLARVSHPRVVIDTRDLSSRATELANELSHTINALPEGEISHLLQVLKNGQAG